MNNWRGKMTVAEMVEGILTEHLVHISRDQYIIITQETRGIGPMFDGAHTFSGLTILNVPDIFIILIMFIRFKNDIDNF